MSIQKIEIDLKNPVTEINNQDIDQAITRLWEILFPKIQYLNQDDQDLVQLAFLQMTQAHKQDRRKSGDFYIIHPVAACYYLAGLRLDAKTLAACLLHDVPEDTDVGLDKLLENGFSEEVVFLVSGITKLGKIKYKGEERYVENLRRMFIAMSQDLRVIFIKLADRLHNLQTLNHVDPEKQLRIAKETIEIYTPIAARLGINALKDEIENVCFKYLHPEEYKKMLSISDLEIKKREKQLVKVEKKIVHLLEKGNIENYKIKSRAKRLFSTYKKLEIKQVDITEIYDLMAVRIIVN